MLKVTKVKVIDERTVYRNPTRMYNFLTDPNSPEAFVYLEDEDGHIHLELLTDISNDYSLLKTKEGLFAVKKCGEENV